MCAAPLCASVVTWPGGDLVAVRDCGLPAAARRPAAGDTAPERRSSPPKSLAPIPMSGFGRWAVAVWRGGGPGTVISTGNYNSALFPGFEQAAVGQECSKGKGLVRKSRIATNQLWREASCRGPGSSSTRGSCWKSPVSSPAQLPPTHSRATHLQCDRSEIRKSVSALQTFCKYFCTQYVIVERVRGEWGTMEPPPAVDLYPQQSFVDVAVPKHSKYPPVSLFNNNIPMTYSPSSLRWVLLFEGCA